MTRPHIPPLSLLVLTAALASFPASAASLTIANAASGTPVIAPDSIATAVGTALAAATLSSDSINWPASLGGTTVSITDSAGIARSALLSYVSPSQVNFLVPAQAALGAATVTITNGAGDTSTGSVSVAPVAPALFAANGNGTGPAAAVALHTAPDGTATSALTFSCGTAPLSCVPIPVNITLNPAAGSTVLELFGTGIRGRSGLAGVTCTVGGMPVEVLYAGPQGTYPGLDQVNLPLPASLPQQPRLDIALTVDGKPANIVTIATVSSSHATADFYIAPAGNDSWSGTLPQPNANSTDGPFASIARAQSAVRAARKSNPNHSLTVMLRDGTYYLPLSPTSPGALNFTQDDSGTASAPVTWQNYPAETPIVSGGQPVGKGGLGLIWTHVADSLWQVQLPSPTPNFGSGVF